MRFVQIEPLTKQEEKIRTELKRLDKLREIQAEIEQAARKKLDELDKQFNTIRDKCPHHADDMMEGYIYDACSLCGELF